LGEQSARSLAWGVARGTAKPEDASAVFTFTGDESRRVAAAKLDLQRERDETQRTLDARRREFAQLGGHGAPDRISALVRIELAAAGLVQIELSYLVLGASWKPRYDARVDVASARLRLTQQAIVVQRTQEEWRQVPLALSTARPSIAVRLPDDPDPWYVDAAPPPPPPVPAGAPLARSPRTAKAMMSMSAAGAAAEAFDGVAGMIAAGEPVDIAADLAVAEVERSGTALVFHLPGQVDVPADGSPHTLSLAEFELSCRLEYVAIPILAEGAHLRAKTQNTTGVVLLPGALHVFHALPSGDEFVGATQLELTAEGADLLLYLGVDDNVTVKRELIERDTEKGNILQSGIRRVTLGYRVTLGNRTAAPQRVILKDRLPVPRHERIKLKVYDLRPEPTARTKLEQMTWELQLAPGEERRVEWRFLVEAPADLSVIGLPS
jgi:uncharacterized protein (TIGR02231 family)